MYKCSVCDKFSAPREPQHRVVVETRHKIYHTKDGKVQGEGTETVREQTMCTDCSKTFNHQESWRA